MNPKHTELIRRVYHLIVDQFYYCKKYKNTTWLIKTEQKDIPEEQNLAILHICLVRAFTGKFGLCLENTTF